MVKAFSEVCRNPDQRILRHVNDRSYSDGAGARRFRSNESRSRRNRISVRSGGGGILLTIRSSPPSQRGAIPRVIRHPPPIEFPSHTPIPRFISTDFARILDRTLLRIVDGYNILWFVEADDGGVEFGVSELERKSRRRWNECNEREIVRVVHRGVGNMRRRKHPLRETTGKVVRFRTIQRKSTKELTV